MERRRKIYPKVRCECGLMVSNAGMAMAAHKLGWKHRVCMNKVLAPIFARIMPLATTKDVEFAPLPTAVARFTHIGAYLSALEDASNEVPPSCLEVRSEFPTKEVYPHIRSRLSL